MGILDQVLGGGARRGGRGMSPLVQALVLALAAKAVQHHMSQRRQAQVPRGTTTAGLNPSAAERGSGGLLDSILGGPTARAGGLGGILGGLAGAGGLGGILDQFRRQGFASQADSWVSRGPNQPIAPSEVEQGLGPGVIEELAQETGLPREQLLSEMSTVLPEAIDELTREGRAPSAMELNAMADTYHGGTGQPLH